MALLEKVTLTNSIEIKTIPENIFNFFARLSDDESYRAWHPDDHVSLRWIKGDPWQEGSVVYAEEYIHGDLHKLKFVITKVVANRKIEYAPVNRFLRFYFPMNVFAVEQKGDICVFIASGTYRIGWLARTFAGKKIKRGLLSVNKHMKEEGGT